MNGIPSFRLEKDVVEAEIDVLRELGVEFRTGVEVGRDVTIAQLREEGYKGFYLAVGLQSGGRLGVPGDDARGVEAGIDFMRAVNLRGEKALSGRVVVIGGGNIAADVARTAVRCGAESVTMYCLEGYDEMPMGEGPQRVRARRRRDPRGLGPDGDHLRGRRLHGHPAAQVPAREERRGALCPRVRR